MNDQNMNDPNPVPEELFLDAVIFFVGLLGASALAVWMLW